jgi:hypothetical protein
VFQDYSLIIQWLLICLITIHYFSLARNHNVFQYLNVLLLLLFWNCLWLIIVLWNSFLCDWDKAVWFFSTGFIWICHWMWLFYSQKFTNMNGIWLPSLYTQYVTQSVILICSRQNQNSNMTSEWQEINILNETKELWSTKTRQVVWNGLLLWKSQSIIVHRHSRINTNNTRCQSFFSDTKKCLMSSQT